MRAMAGDKLVAGSGGIALIVNVLGPDGHPPYIVKWLNGGNIAMVDPDPYARVIPADSPPSGSEEHDQARTRVFGQGHLGLPTLLRPSHGAQSGKMFNAQDQLLQVSLDVAQTRLVNLASRDGLSRASQHAYESGLDPVIRVGPLGDMPGVSKLVRVSFLDPVYHENAMTLGLRWEATGVAGGLFPVLDGNLTLTRIDDATTQLALIASYRPPLGNLGAGLDRAILSRVAEATIRALLRSIGSAIVNPEPATATDAMPSSSVVSPARIPLSPSES